MVAVAAWWDRHGIMGVGEGRDPRLAVPGAWFPFSRCLVPRRRGGWLRHDIVSMGGGCLALGEMLFPTSRPSAPTPIRCHRMAPDRSGALRPMGACRMAHQN